MRANVLGVLIDGVTYDQARDLISGWWEGHAGHFITTPNPEILVYAKHNPEYMDTIAKADLAIPDGVGVILAGKILGTPFQNRLTGADLAEGLIELSAKRGKRVFFLGGRNNVAQEAADVFRRRFPELKVVGSAEGDPDASYDQQTRDLLGTDRIDLLLVAYGHPKQEYWIARNLSHLNVKVAMGIGGSFDFWSGKARRAPYPLRALGFEWAYRLIREPWRWRRQLALPQFVALVLRQRLGL